MNFVFKRTLFSSAALLCGMLLSGCGSVEEPVFSDNPNPPATAGIGAGTAMGTGTSAGTQTDTGNGSGAETPANGMDSVPNGAPRFQAGETVSVSTSTGSEMYNGPISAPGQSYLIADDGTITLPLIGPVQAGGKTPGELQDEIETNYVPKYYVRLDVTVTSPNRVYYVGGEVAHAGPEVYMGEITVTKAIQSAGDFTQFASHKVWLNRADGTHIRVNVDKALRDSSDDPPVYPGDQIQVPRRYF